MSRRSQCTALAVFLLSALAPVPIRAFPVPQQPAAPLSTIAGRTRGLERHDGFIPYYFNDESGELLLEVTHPGQPFLYITYVAAGARRGPSTTDARLVHFEQNDRRLFLVQENVEYRASGTVNPGLDRTVREEYPTSVLWAFPIVAREGERLLVQAGDFLFRQNAMRGLRLARDRSSFAAEHSGAFADNTDLEAVLTYASDQPQQGAAQRAPDPRTLTVRERHSFARLPSPGYRSRPFDPRVGLDYLSTWDFGRPPEAGLRSYVTSGRWRLEKRDPGAPLSDPVEPLVVYLEQGIPRAYRAAVRDGVLYWSRALEAAGFRNAIEVRDLPPDASPLDQRYPIGVTWEAGNHVSTGVTTFDPRTGEALKGIVSLSSDVPLYAWRYYTSVHAALGDSAPPFETYLGQHLRWHAAHEFGHVLSVRHNEASPTMVSQPMPWLDVSRDGRLLADPEPIFPAEPFPYDRWMMRYEFTPFATEREEREGLAAIVEEALGEGLQYMHEDMWLLSPLAVSGAHGEDPLVQLERESAVRRLLLGSFGEGVLASGDPPELLFERLVPVYFHHRLGIGAAATDVCGLEFEHSKAGDGEGPPRPIAASIQEGALRALTAALEPGELAIPEAAASLIPPRHPAYKPFELEYTYEEPPTYWPLPAFVGIENSPDGAFDPLAWARALAGLIVNPLTRPERLGRCATQHVRDPALPSASDVLAYLVDGTWNTPLSLEPMPAALQRVARRVVLDRMLALARDSTTTPELRSALFGSLVRLRDQLRDRPPGGDPVGDDHRLLALHDIDGVLGRESR